MDGGVEGKGGLIFVGDLLPLHGEQKEASKQAAAENAFNFSFTVIIKRYHYSPPPKRLLNRFWNPESPFDEVEEELDDPSEEASSESGATHSPLVTAKSGWLISTQGTSLESELHSEPFL